MFPHTTGRPRRSGAMTAEVRLDHDLLTLLVLDWAIRSGHHPPDRPPHQLSEEQLIAFWADEQTATGGLPAWRG
ncbi:hypothetical protein ABGB17_16975 [Sphaerisporangium sp. B11E5]|uniref:hypothetical protein n=1 Tax=Sphaerisporangium sp. B11E5 TaxID=3153563 RepID=UPI00325EAE10